MGKSLSELVNAALTEADQGLKLASARDAEILDPGDFLAAELSYAKVAEEECDEDEDDKSKPKADKEDKAEKTEKKASFRVVLSDADYAMKLAEALELGGNVVTAKLAEGQSHTDAPGPAVMESGFEHALTVQPKSTTTSVPGPQKSHGGGGSENTMGAPNGIETNESDFTSMGDESGRAKNHPGKTAGWTRSKQASIRLLNAKVAQAETLRRLGQIKAAEQLEHEIRKQAADFEVAGETDGNFSSGKPHHLDTEPGDASHIPDNSSLISMTRAQARDKTTREVGQYISESPKTDNAVAAHTLTAEGLKLSALLPKTAAKKNEDEGPHRLRGALRGGAAAGLTGGALGAATAGGGAALGYRRLTKELQSGANRSLLRNNMPPGMPASKIIHGLRTNKGKIIGGAAALGGLVSGLNMVPGGMIGGAVGPKSAKTAGVGRKALDAADRALQSVGEKAMNTVGAGAGKASPGLKRGVGAAVGGTGALAVGGGGALAHHKLKKESELDPEVARAYLRKVAAIAHDPEAHPEDRAKASGLIQQIQSRSAVNPDDLLG